MMTHGNKISLLSVDLTIIKALSDGVVDLRNLIGLEQCNNSHIALNFIIALRETVQIKLMR